jgi:hypothetical protein
MNETPMSSVSDKSGDIKAETQIPSQSTTGKRLFVALSLLTLRYRYKVYANRMVNNKHNVRPRECERPLVVPVFCDVKVEGEETIKWPK